MQLDSQTLSWFVLGVVVGLLVCAAVFVLVRRQLQMSYRRQLEHYEQTILDLREEQAEGRETNRRLRHELAVSTPEHFGSTRAELIEAEHRLVALEARLAESKEHLAVRDRSLREARLAIQEVRIQLEEGRFGDASAQSIEFLDNDVAADVQTASDSADPAAEGHVNVTDAWAEDDRSVANGDEAPAQAKSMEDPGVGIVIGDVIVGEPKV